MTRKKNVSLTRQRADELVQVLMDRIEAVNKDPQYLFGVSRVLLFGSYLTDKVRLGDLDVSVEIGPKCRDWVKHRKLCDAQCQEAPRGGNIVDHVFWPQTKTMRGLRGRNYAFSVHDWREVEHLFQAGAPYREIYRNPEFDWLGVSK